MPVAKMKFAIDDGSTNVKVSWIEKGVLKTIISPNSFRKDWKSAALLKGQKVFNYTIGTTKYTYDATSDKALSTPISNTSTTIRTCSPCTTPCYRPALNLARFPSW